MRNFVSKRSGIFPLALSAFLAFSCSDLDSPPESLQALEKVAGQLGVDPNEPGLSFAAALANGLQNETLRQFVFDKTQEQFDGDFNFLYYTEKNENLGEPNSKSLTFQQALFGDQSNFRTTQSEFELDPLMQIALRGKDDQLLSMDNLDPNTPVLYISPDQVLDENPMVPVVHPTGEVSEWDIRVIPDQPVLVVGINERLVKISKNPSARLAQLEPCVESATPYFSDDSNDYYFYNEVYCGGGGGGVGGTPGGGSTGCDRDQNVKPDKLDRAKFDSDYWFDQAEEWLDGKPEVYYIMFTGASQPHLAQLPPKSLPLVDRSRWKDCGIFSCTPEWVFNINLEMFNWDPLVYGRAVTVRFYEYDPGDSESQTNSVTVKDANGNTQTFSRTWTISNNDFDLFGTPVDYCDDATGSNLKIYTTGRFQFGMTIDG